MKALAAIKWTALFALAITVSGCPLWKKKGAITPSDTVFLAWDAAPRSLDSRYAQDATSQYLEDLIHCSLFSFGEHGEVIGELAEFWSWRDPVTLEVRVRQDALFSDGTAVSSGDVAATYRFFLGEATPPSPRAGAFRNVKQVTATAPDTLVFKLSEPDASFVTNLVVGILPQRLANAPLVETAEQSIGCGPFRIEQALINRMVLARNDQFSLSAPPLMSRIIIEYVREEQTRFAKLVKGELDFVQNLISRDKLPEIARRHPQLHILRRPGLNTTYLGFNMQDPLTGRHEVRQAIAHAINREVIIEHILHGLATPATTLLTPNDAFLATDLVPYEHSIDQANAILDQAGLLRGTDGIRFTLSYKTTTDITRVSIARAVASQLRQIGINVNVQPMEWGRFRSDVEQGLVQMWSLSWIGFKDPDIYRFAFASENFPPQGPNRGRFSDPRLDEVLRQASRSTDITERIKLYHEAQHIVNAQLPYVFLWHEELFAVAQTRLNDFTIFADGRLSSLTKVSKR